MAELLKTDMPDLKRIYSGKVRDIYEVEVNYLMVTTDRLSAFDVVMSRGIPDRGKMLTEISLFWFDFFKGSVGNHLITADVDKMPQQVRKYRDQLEGRTMYVHKADMLKVECVARGYIVGSGWKDYQKTGAVCGHTLPAGLQLAEQLPRPLFTPATKADQGEHDENIDFEHAAQIVGQDMATRLRDLTLTLYTRAAEYARKKSIIIADTKSEIGMIDGILATGDARLLTDRSRSWEAEAYAVANDPERFDKQSVRGWLETQRRNQEAPPPNLADEIVKRPAARYREVI